ncbi:uncharacterized protein LOC135845054 [Planococcus citri]|uniref:uncharacterized protein LOC135845054 n=1 Tax=Planococcus citri TaxID=170843 RepID=UPI0031F8D20A
MSINQTLGENYDDESFKERYVFHYELPSLQQIASYEVCRTIWYSNLSKFQLIEAKDTNVIHCRFMIGYCLFFHYQKHNEQLIKHLNVPASIEGILVNSMTKVCKEIEDWVTEFYQYTINLESHSRIHLIDPKWWVWSMNGEIDCSRSARRVLQDGSLTEWQKFLVMCKYCMTDEISKFSLDSLPPQLFNENCHCSNSICFYWICFLRNELHRIPVRNNDSIDSAIFRYYAESPIVKNFFWNRLNDDQQVALVADWINVSLPKRTSDFIISLQMISKMLLSQQQRLLRETRHKIVSFFAPYSDSSRCALWAWRYAGNQMTVGQFANLIKILLETSINEKSTSLLNEIWNTASAHQRYHAIQYKLDQLIKTLRKNSSTCSDRLLQFISEDERKESILRSVNRNAIQHCDVDYLSNFLNEYLPCPEDQSTFRKLIIDSPAFLDREIVYYNTRSESEVCLVECNLTRRAEGEGS